MRLTFHRSSAKTTENSKREEGREREIDGDLTHTLIYGSYRLKVRHVLCPPNPIELDNATLTSLRRA